MITCNRYRSRVCFIFLTYPTAFLRAEVAKRGVSKRPGRCHGSPTVTRGSGGQRAHPGFRFPAPKALRSEAEEGAGLGTGGLPRAPPELCPTLWRPRRHMQTPQPPAKAAVSPTDLPHAANVCSQ